MKKRYEVRISRPSRKIKPRNLHFSRTIYGVWDNKINNWVINARDVGYNKAKTIEGMLNGR